MSFQEIIIIIVKTGDTLSGTVSLSLQTATCVRFNAHE